MNDIKCEVCGHGPQTGHTIFRTGGKGPGVNPHWRCEQHCVAAVVDPDVQQAVAIIEAAKGVRHG